MNITSGDCSPLRPDAPVLLVHGGAWDIPDAACPEHHAGMHEALTRGRSLLLQGASAVEVVAQTVAVMEGHGAFDAGCGAVLTQDGTVELDAGIMDGHHLAFGAVANVQRIAHPVLLAQRLMQEGHGQVRLLAGTGAEHFAQAQAFPLIENKSLICPREQARYEDLLKTRGYHTSFAFLPPSVPRGTVGCVARDSKGRLAAATSTGGTPFRPSGRIGDTPLPGCGYYANTHAAASSTGWGEAIATVLLAGRAVDRVHTTTTPETVAREQIQQMYEQVRNQHGQGATGGLILLDRHGRGGWAFSTPRMARGGWTAGMEPWTSMATHA